MENRDFRSIKIKSKTAKEFREFSRHLGKQQSETVQLMMDFFHNHSLSPLDQLGPNFTTLEKRIQMRINAVIAIVRDIEKNQTKPTLAMLQLLFQEIPAKPEVLVEKKTISEAPDGIEKFEFQKRNQLLQTKLSRSRTIIITILERVVISRSSFGKIQLRLLMTQQELEEIKQQLKIL